MKILNPEAVSHAYFEGYFDCRQGKPFAYYERYKLERILYMLSFYLKDVFKQDFNLIDLEPYYISYIDTYHGGKTRGDFKPNPSSTA